MNGGGCRSAPSSNPKDSNTAFDQVVRRETYPRRRPPVQDQQISSIQEMTTPVPWPKNSSRNPALVMYVQVQLFAYSQRYMAFPSAVLRETTVRSAQRGKASPASASHECHSCHNATWRRTIRPSRSRSACPPLTPDS